MKIIIDTSIDSKEDIKKAANFLLGIAGSEQSSGLMDAPKEGMFNMFDSSETTAESSKPNEKKPFRITEIIPYD